MTHALNRQATVGAIEAFGGRRHERVAALFAATRSASARCAFATARGVKAHGHWIVVQSAALLHVYQSGSSIGAATQRPCSHAGRTRVCFSRAHGPGVAGTPGDATGTP